MENMFGLDPQAFADSLRKLNEVFDPFKTMPSNRAGRRRLQRGKPNKWTRPKVAHRYNICAEPLELYRGGKRVKATCGARLPYYRTRCAIHDLPFQLEKVNL